MANIISKEEQDYIVVELSRTNKDFELANIFISLDSMDIDSLFQYKYQQKYKFYYNVFKEIYRYSIKKLSEFRIDEVVKNVTDKIQCEYYTNDKYYNNFIDENFLTSHFIESLFNYINNSGLDNNFSIKILYSLTMQQKVDPLVIKEILIKNHNLINIDLLYEIITNKLLSDSDLIDVIMIAYKYYDNDTLDKLITQLYSDKESLLEFTRNVMDRFKIYYDVLPSKKDKCKVKIKIVPYKYKGKEEKQCLIYLRKFLSDVIYSDAELEIMEFLTESYNMLKGTNKLISEYLLQYILWLSSDDRRKNRIANYLKYNYEEGEMWPYENYEYIINTLQVKKYINEINSLNNYSLFLRVFNINRFFLFQYTSMETLKYRIQWSYDTYEYYIDNAFDTDLYIFLNIIDE